MTDINEALKPATAAAAAKTGRKKPGPRPRKGTDAALALRDIYTDGVSDDRKLLRMIVESGYSHTFLREIADAMESIDEDGMHLALDLVAVVDKRASN